MAKLREVDLVRVYEHVLMVHKLFILGIIEVWNRYLGWDVKCGVNQIPPSVSILIEPKGTEKETANDMSHLIKSLNISLGPEGFEAMEVSSRHDSVKLLFIRAVSHSGMAKALLDRKSKEPAKT